MKNSKYTAKEIVFGLRNELLKSAVDLEKLKGLLSYNRDNYEVQPSFMVGSSSKIQLNIYESTPRSTIMGMLKHLVSNRYSYSAVIEKESDNNYVISVIRGNSKKLFPVHVDKNNTEEFNMLLDEILNYSYIRVFNDKESAIRNGLDSLTPSDIAFNRRTIDKKFYNGTYQANDDQIIFATNAQYLSKEFIEQMLNTKYDVSLFSEEARNLIESNNSNIKPVVIKGDKFKNQETFFIDERPRELVLLHDSSKSFKY